MKGKTSNYRGVSWDSSANKWKSKTTIDGEQIYLGLFDKEIDASNAYQNAAVRTRSVESHSKMLSQRQLDNIVYSHFSLNKPLDEIIYQYTHIGTGKLVNGKKSYSLKSNAYSVMKQITFAINKRNIERYPTEKTLQQKNDSYYDNEMLYGETTMLECLKDGSIYDMTKLTIEDVIGELPKRGMPSSHKDMYEETAINIEYI